MLKILLLEWFHFSYTESCQDSPGPLYGYSITRNPFSFCAQQFTDPKYRVCRCRARVIANKMQFQISSSSAN